MTSTTTSKKTVRTTTNHLKAGDVVQHGNCIAGFSYSTIANVQPSGSNKHWMTVSETFESGNTIDVVHGKNAIWDVVKVGA